jgi:hypothetical protein
VCWRAKKTKALGAVRVASALQLKLKGDLTAAHREQEAVVSAYYNGEGSLSEIRAGNKQKKQESRQERRERKEAQNKVSDYYLTGLAQAGAEQGYRVPGSGGSAYY